MGCTSGTFRNIEAQYDFVNLAKTIAMLTVRGIYEDGQVKLLDKIAIPEKQQVLITFIDNDEDEARKLSLKQTSEELTHYLSDEREDLYQEYVKK